MHAEWCIRCTGKEKRIEIWIFKKNHCDYYRSRIHHSGFDFWWIGSFGELSRNSFNNSSPGRDHYFIQPCISDGGKRCDRQYYRYQYKQLFRFNIGTSLRWSRIRNRWSQCHRSSDKHTRSSNRYIFERQYHQQLWCSICSVQYWTRFHRNLYGCSSCYRCNDRYTAHIHRWVAGV